MGRTACTEPQRLYKGALYLRYLQPPYTALGNPLSIKKVVRKEFAIIF